MDDNGKLRGVFTVNDSGPSLKLLDSKRITRAEFVADSDGSRLTLANAVGRIRAGFALSPNGNPGLNLADTAGNLRGVFAMEGNRPGLLLSGDKPALYLLDAAGRERGDFSLDKDGSSPVLDGCRGKGARDILGVAQRQPRHEPV